MVRLEVIIVNGLLEYRPFGSTGERVSVIGLGGANLDNYSFADGVATVRRALELGVNYFDTAHAYGNSQMILGEALEGRTEPYLLATKVGRLPKLEDLRTVPALRAQFRDCLRALRRNKIEILQIHVAELECWWKDGAPQKLLNLNESYDFANAPVIQVLQEAKEQGLCRFIGITCDDHASETAYLLRHLSVDSCLVARNYHLLIRRARQLVLPLASQKGVAYIAAEVIKPIIHSSLARLHDLQKACGLSLVAMAVRYMVADPAISTILVGAATPAELEESVAAAQAGPLPSNLHQALEDLVKI